MSEETTKPEELNQAEKSHKVSYAVVVGFKRVGTFDNFPEAFKKIDEEVEDITSSTSFIIRTSNDIELYLPCSKAFDLAYGIGLFQETDQDGECVGPVFTDMPQAANLEEIVKQEFIDRTREVIVAHNNEYIEYLNHIIEKAVKGGASILQLSELSLMITRAKKSNDSEIQRVDSILAEA